MLTGQLRGRAGFQGSRVARHATLRRLTSWQRSVCGSRPRAETVSVVSLPRRTRMLHCSNLLQCSIL